MIFLRIQEERQYRLRLDFQQRCSFWLQDAFREQLRLKRLEDRQIEVDAPSSRMPVDVPGMSQVQPGLVKREMVLAVLSGWVPSC